LESLRLRKTIQPRQFIQAVTLTALICFLITLFVISTQSTPELNLLDNPWYLNRARLIWQGVLPDLFVYTLAYPTFVGLLDQFLHDVLLSGMIANGVFLWLILIGTYILGHWLYGGNRVAWLAVLLVTLNASLFHTLRLFWASVPFTAAMLWCIIACFFVIRRPGYGTAALLGGVLALALYTRFEGALYAILIPISAWIIYRQSRDGRLATRVFLTAALIFAALAAPFVLNFIFIRQNMNYELSTNVTGIFTLLDRTPIEWEVIWRRVTDTLTGFLSHWPSLAWLVGIAGVIWASPRYRTAQWLVSTLIGFNLLYTFVLAIWPYPIHIVFYIPLFALILAATLNQLIRQGRRSRLLATFLCVLMLLPGISTLVFLSTHEPVMAYPTFDIAHTGAALDAWLEEQGWTQRYIYTFCGSIASFSRANFQIMYRLQYVTGWDTPERLIPQMREQGALMMTCEERIPFFDWRTLFEHGIPPGLHEVGRFDIYIFYGPDELR
jgi:hypothetical protein